MRWLATLAMAVALLSSTAASWQDYTFGEWAKDNGYSPGDALPNEVWADNSKIDSLNGIHRFNLTNVYWLHLDNNRLSSIESGDFSGLPNLTELFLDDNTALTQLNLEAADFSNLYRFDVEYGDGAVNGLDVAPFVAAVVGGTQPVPEPSALALLLVGLVGLAFVGRDR